MIICPWTPIERFGSIKDFYRFESWMVDQIDAGNAVEQPVASPYMQIQSFREKWFKHQKSGTIWRLVSPDEPFEGLFEQVLISI